MSDANTFCREILPRVSRTFALNIPVLPEPLDAVVTVAYLLCRMADTLEDEAQGPVPERTRLLQSFAELVTLPKDWAVRSDTFARRAVNVLRAQAPEAEVELLKATSSVLAALAGLPKSTHPHIARCVRIMTDGMAEFSASLAGEGRAVDGLPTLGDTQRYCYYVAGVVGEMLTGLFVDASTAAKERAQSLESRAAAFGRTLQLTNILKDVREDLDRGYCWLPKDRMAAHGLSAPTLCLTANRTRAVALYDELIAAVRADADAAFEYSMLLPAESPGMRLFCLWPLFFAVETLSAVKGNPLVFDPAPVKISRATVQELMLKTQAAVADDAALRTLYAQRTQALRGTGAGT
jgi:farnesyl-diphosphate farnesyltransferase